MNELIGTLAMILLLAEPSLSQSKSTALATVGYEQVSLCELVRHPESYNGKTIVVSASIGSNPEFSVFFDDACPTSTEDEVYALSTFKEGTLEGSPLGKKLSKLMKRDFKKLKRKSVQVTVIAHFTDGKDRVFGHLNCCRYTLEVQQLLAVQKQKSPKRG